MKQKYDWSIGTRYRMLTIIGEIVYRTNPARRNIPYVLCRCDCGNEKEISVNSLRDGARNTISCGCHYKQERRKCGLTHGKSGTRLHAIWKGILSRCHNPNRESFKRYGGRGIMVCDEWREDFPAFEKWSLANGYAYNLTIDRIDNNGSYQPDNCRWITLSENIAYRNFKYVTHSGEKKSIKEWAKDNRCLVSYDVLRHRLAKGWKFEDAMKRPSRL